MFRLCQKGYTFVETAVALAVISLLTLSIMSGAGVTNRNERFLGEVKSFANTISEAQVNSFATRTGTCASGPCYWRGNVLEYSLGDAQTYPMQLLYGDDLALYSDNRDQRIGIKGKQVYRQIPLGSTGLNISKITVAGNPVSSVSLAFLAPDGNAYTRSSIINPASTPLPYTGKDVIVFELTDAGAGITGVVTFDPVNSKITTEVK